MYSIVRNWINRYFAEEEAVLLILMIIAAVVVLMTMGDILAPLIASVVIAFLMQGMVIRLKGWGVPHLASVSIATVVLIGSMALLLLVLLPGLWQQTVRLIGEIPALLEGWRDLLLLLPQKYPNWVSEAQVEQLINLAATRLGAMGQNIVSFSIAKLPVLLAVAVYIVLVPILVFFFLKDGQQVLRWLSSFLPNERPVMTQIWLEMNLQIANYVRGKVIEILIVAGVSYLAFVLLGLNYALLLALAVGFSVLIPYIGATVVTLPIAMIAFFQWGWSSEFLTVLIVYGVIQMLDGNVLVPLLFSEAVNLHPIAIIFAVLFFGGIWGFWGVFFAIPLATLIKAIINAWPTGERVMAYTHTETPSSTTEDREAS
ncbi:AI-2E family transporter [Gilvimarinus sp. F26214L]|uniref:AI-2E family transporter n=1 Tax=Gilvimarinus sp. DZF01 TaxID=3461371 RepID=UPI00404571B6